MADGQLHVHPDLLKIVEAVSERVAERVIGGLDVINLQKCQDELKEVVIQLRNVAQRSNAYEKIAELQGDNIDRLKSEKAQLEAENDRLRAENVSLLAELAKVSRKP